jgi:hypothetical protein
MIFGAFEAGLTAVAAVQRLAGLRAVRVKLAAGIIMVTAAKPPSPAVPQETSPLSPNWPP